MSSLQYLDVSNVLCFSMIAFEGISNGCEHLKLLNLERSGGYPSLALPKLSNCKQLEYLNVSEVKNIEPIHLMTLVEHLRNLRVLAMENRRFSPQIAQSVLSKAPSIETLAIWHLDNVGLQSIETWAESIGAGKLKLKNLFVSDIDTVSETLVEKVSQKFDVKIRQDFNWDQEVPSWSKFAKNCLGLKL